MATSSGHPGKPRDGIRAEQSDAIWHVDTTVIRLLDGTKTFLHAVIDDFSRRGDGLPDQLIEARAETRARRMESNRGSALCVREEKPTPNRRPAEPR